jgi:hypothetical protein
MLGCFVYCPPVPALGVAVGVDVGGGAIGLAAAFVPGGGSGGIGVGDAAVAPASVGVAPEFGSPSCALEVTIWVNTADETDLQAA